MNETLKQRNEFDWPMCRDWLDKHVLRIQYITPPHCEQGRYPLWIWTHTGDHRFFGTMDRTLLEDDPREAIEWVCEKQYLTTPWAPEPKVEWSEPVGEMSPNRCRGVAQALGGGVASFWYREYWYGVYLLPGDTTFSRSTGGLSKPVIADRLALLHLAENMDCRDVDTDRIRLSK